MKRKISIMVVLVICVSMCLSSMSFASSRTSVSGYAGSHSANGGLSFGGSQGQERAEAWTGAGGNSYVEAEVEFKYLSGSIHTPYTRTASASGYTGISATARPGHSPITFQAARGRHLARNANGTWHPVSPSGTKWATWINVW